MPGLVDTHIHAAQYSFAGTALDLPLLDWLQTYTFPVESRYSDLEFARQVYTHVVVSAAPLSLLCLVPGRYTLRPNPFSTPSPFPMF